MIEPVSQVVLKRVEERVRAETGRQGSAGVAYRMRCPRCMRWQVRETLMRDGCFACGWKRKGME